MKWYKMLCWTVLLSVLAGGCSEKTKKPDSLQDAPVAAFQTELLDEAFEFAAAIPLEPHIKDRARCQEQTVKAALELDQPTRALQYAGTIPNWRKGWAYASYALYSTEHGFTNGLDRLLLEADLAARYAEQDWRRERVWVRIAQAWGAMGCADRAAEYGSALKDSEMGAAELQKSKLCTDAEFEEYSARLDEQLAVGGLDLKKNGLYAYAALHDRFYDNESRRSTIEDKIETGWDKVPYFDRVDLLKVLSGNAMKHGDRENAVHLADRAVEIVNGNTWPPEYHVQLLAKLAKLNIDCGETAAAMEELEAARAVFDAQKADIINIYRTEALLPVAEAYALADDAGQAREMYALAVEQAVVNSNSRPRAEDLCQILLSMATHGVEPDAGSWTRIHDIKSSLGDPW